MNDILPRILSLGPNRRLIAKLGTQSLGRRICDSFSKSNTAFASIEEAEAACLAYHPTTAGHVNTSLIISNFHGSTNLRTSDYPVLFWLQKLQAESELTVFDFGGGLGQVYIAMSPLLDSNRVTWIVQDLPEIVAAAANHDFYGKRPVSITFTSDLSDARTANVFLAAGALHYWPGTMAELLRCLDTKPQHFIINRSPIRSTGQPYYTVQEGDDWAVACYVRTLRSLEEEMNDQGYRLMDSWLVPEKNLCRPWRPDLSCPYQGAYFKLI